MNEFCNTIELFLAADILDASPAALTVAPSRTPRLVAAVHLDRIAVKPAYDAAGTHFTVDETIALHPVDAATARLYATHRDAVIRLSRTDGTVVILGHPAAPARALITASEPYATLHLTLKTAKSPL